MSDDVVERVRAALEKLLPAPWEKLRFVERFGWYLKAPPPADRDWSGDHVGYVFREQDADALVLLRNEAPALLATIEAQRERIATLEAEVERARESGHAAGYAEAHREWRAAR